MIKGLIAYWFLHVEFVVCRFLFMKLIARFLRRNELSSLNLYIDFSHLETILFAKLMESFVLETCCMLIFLFAKFAHRFICSWNRFVKGTCCMIIFVHGTCFVLIFCSQGFFSPRETDFVEWTSCMLIFVHVIYCVVIFVHETFCMVASSLFEYFTSIFSSWNWFFSWILLLANFYSRILMHVFSWNLLRADFCS